MVFHLLLIIIVGDSVVFVILHTGGKQPKRCKGMTKMMPLAVTEKLMANLSWSHPGGEPKFFLFRFLERGRNPSDYHRLVGCVGEDHTIVLVKYMLERLNR